jgi:hypothetical protein
MSDLLFRIADQGRVVYAVQQGGDLFEVEGDIFDRYGAGAPIPGGLASVRVLAPVLPSKIVAVGLDYLDHAVEPGKRRPTSSPSFRPSDAASGRYHFHGDTGRHRSPLRRGRSSRWGVSGVGDLVNPVVAG